MSSLHALHLKEKLKSIPLTNNRTSKLHHGSYVTKVNYKSAKTEGFDRPDILIWCRWTSFSGERTSLQNASNYDRRYEYGPELTKWRVLAMGAHSAELYNNLGLCCLYSQQLDLTLPCFQRALDLATDAPIRADVWYNLSHVAIAAGDVELAIRCLTLCISLDSTHASAYNNLAVLHHKTGKTNLAKAYLTSAREIEPTMVESQSNLELLQDG